jgi:hypothetical protein
MESFRPHEIRRVAQVWQDAHDMPWLVVAAFAEVDGRVRCVGLELRSYVAQKESVAVDQGDWPTTEKLSYEAYWTGGPVREAEPGDDVGLTARLARIEPAWQALAGHDLLAVEAGAQGVKGSQRPHTLRTETLRDLPLGRVLQELRGRLARQTGGLGEAILALHREVEQAAGNSAAVSELELWQANLQEAREALRAAPKRPGRPRKYNRANLEQVARLYSEAVRAGSSCPDKDVSRTLKLGSRGIAAKLIKECRRPEVGLLDATEPRKAGGISQPSSQVSDPSSGPERTSSQ